MGKCLHVLVCIDDTDNLESRGTGLLALMLMELIAKQGWGKGYGVTRHQLLVHPDIPYTSHNSAMCFAAGLDPDRLAVLIARAADFLVAESAPGSDPGLCVAVPALLPDPAALIDFGRQAKKRVIVKSEAYQLARDLRVHLSEHGGTGQGVIGALAGAGLRLSGNDGRFRGQIDLKTDAPVLSVREICRLAGVDTIRGMDGTGLPPEEPVLLAGSKVKPVLQDGKPVLLVCPVAAGTREAVRWRTCRKQELRGY
ncbi:MAG: hypothetical protein PHU78_05495 [Heliobacteriaceae bacterium]|nr:hypothetical protein [Heliobacteriaceae bacterium]